MNTVGCATSLSQPAKARNTSGSLTALNGSVEIATLVISCRDSFTRRNMVMNNHSNSCHCSGRGIHRRTFLADLGMGFTGLVLGAMLQRDGIARASAPPTWTPPDGKPHSPPKAKSVIWL